MNSYFLPVIAAYLAHIIKVREMAPLSQQIKELYSGQFERVLYSLYYI